MDNSLRLQIAEEELREQSLAAGISFELFAERMQLLFNLDELPTDWNNAASVWIDVIYSFIESDGEKEIINQAAELIEEIKNLS